MLPLNIDAIMRIPFVFLPVCAGLTIGLYCVEHLLRQRGRVPHDPMKMVALQRLSKMKYVCVAVLVALTFIPPSRAVWPEKNPAEAVRNFYAWYVHEVVNGSRPLEKEQEQMRKFVTEGLLSRINKTPKGPGGLDGDFFLNAQEVDPEWGKNVAVSNYYVGKTMSKLGVILTGRKLGDRQFEVKVLFQEGVWKIDEVKFSD